MKAAVHCDENKDEQLEKYLKKVVARIQRNERSDKRMLQKQ